MKTTLDMEYTGILQDPTSVLADTLNIGFTSKHMRWHIVPSTIIHFPQEMMDTTLHSKHSNSGDLQIYHDNLIWDKEKLHFFLKQGHPLASASADAY
jgi:hypothetical protein